MRLAQNFTTENPPLRRPACGGPPRERPWTRTAARRTTCRQREAPWCVARRPAWVWWWGGVADALHTLSFNRPALALHAWRLLPAATAVTAGTRLGCRACMPPPRAAWPWTGAPTLSPPAVNPSCCAPLTLACPCAPPSPSRLTVEDTRRVARCTAAASNTGESHLTLHAPQPAHPRRSAHAPGARHAPAPAGSIQLRCSHPRLGVSLRLPRTPSACWRTLPLTAAPATRVGLPPACSVEAPLAHTPGCVPCHPERRLPWFGGRHSVPVARASKGKRRAWGPGARLCATGRASDTRVRRTQAPGVCGWWWQHSACGVVVPPSLGRPSTQSLPAPARSHPFVCLSLLHSHPDTAKKQVLAVLKVDTHPARRLKHPAAPACSCPQPPHPRPPVHPARRQRGSPSQVTWLLLRPRVRSCSRGTRGTRESPRWRHSAWACPALALLA